MSVSHKMFNCMSPTVQGVVFIWSFQAKNRVAFRTWGGLAFWFITVPIGRRWRQCRRCRRAWFKSPFRKELAVQLQGLRVPPVSTFRSFHSSLGAQVSPFPGSSGVKVWACWGHQDLDISARDFSNRQLCPVSWWAGQGFERSLLWSVTFLPSFPFSLSSLCGSDLHCVWETFIPLFFHNYCLFPPHNKSFAPNSSASASQRTQPDAGVTCPRAAVHSCLSFYLIFERLGLEFLLQVTFSMLSVLNLIRNINAFLRIVFLMGWRWGECLPCSIKSPESTPQNCQK
jgi:hypothetical protein